MPSIGIADKATLDLVKANVDSLLAAQIPDYMDYIAQDGYITVPKTTSAETDVLSISGRGIIYSLTMTLGKYDVIIDGNTFITVDVKNITLFPGIILGAQNILGATGFPYRSHSGINIATFSDFWLYIGEPTDPLKRSVVLLKKPIIFNNNFKVRLKSPHTSYDGTVSYIGGVS